MSRWVFGPVPSRRLGMSLGVDTVPCKSCNWNCVYCQLGRSAPITNSRREYGPPAEIAREVEARLEASPAGEIDWVTFVASGETALNAGLGWLIRRVKAATDLPVAVITNGSLLHLPEVRQELSAADAVLPSVDAGDEQVYRRMNRAHPDCTHARLIDGLRAFRAMYRGSLWVETMLVRGLNDGAEALEAIASVLERVKPDSIQVNVPTRPPAEAWVEPPDREALERAVAVLGATAAAIPAAARGLEIPPGINAGDFILEVVARHPMSHDDISRALQEWAARASSAPVSVDVDAVLENLESTGRARRVVRYCATFWGAPNGQYAGDSGTATSKEGAVRE